MLHRTINKLSLAALAVGLFGALSASSATAASLEAQTQAASNVGAYSATLNGSIVKQPSESFAWAGYEYGTTTAYGSDSEAVDLTGKGGSIAIPLQIEGLQPKTTYHFRAGVFGDDSKVVYGEDMTFTTTAKSRFAVQSLLDLPFALELESASSDPLSFGIEGGPFSCESLTADSKVFSFGGGAFSITEVSLAPSFAGCQLGGFAAATVEANGCELVLHAGDSGTATGVIDVACPEGEAIEVTAGTCNFSIPAQTGLAPITETNDASTAPDSVDVAPNAGGLAYTKTKDGILCPFNGTGTREDGTLSGSAVLNGSKEGAPVGIEIVS